MLISIYRAAEDILSLEFECKNIKDVLSGIKLIHGQAVTDDLLHNSYKYILRNGDDVVALDQAVISSAFGHYNELIIIRDIGGETGVEEVAALLVAAGATAGALTTAAAYIIVIAIDIAISLALNAIMSLLSPTPEFNKDPSQSQNKQSALFNGAPLVREQGGSVPLILGAPFCGGVLISSGVFTEDA